MFSLECTANLFFQRFFSSSGWISFWLACSNLIVFMALVTALVYYICVDREIGYCMILALCITALIVAFVKDLSAIERPFQMDARIMNLDPKLSTGYSFPSMHCALAASCVSCVYSTFCRYISFRKITFMLLLLLIALSRIVLGSHYVHDCIVGLVLGLVSGFFVVRLFESYGNYIYGGNIAISSVLILIGFAGCILSQSGIGFFSDFTAEYCLLTAIGAFMLGNKLERDSVRVNCDGRTLKCTLRLVVLALAVLLVSKIFFMIVAPGALSKWVIVVFNCLFVTYIYSILGSKMNLFEDVERNTEV